MFHCGYAAGKKQLDFSLLYKWTEFECRTFFASDRKGDGTDCHVVHPLR